MDWNNKTFFTQGLNKDITLKIPIAHGEGNYYADKETLDSLLENDQIVFKYSSIDGIVNEESNPNGSLLNIAGIVNKEGNILGLMPHPERASNSILGKTDGGLILKAIVNNFES